MPQHIMDEGTRYRLLKKIEANPEMSQREMALELGISLGKVNYCLKALIKVGLVKVGNFTRSKHKASYAYYLTSAGAREKVATTLRFLEQKQKTYEQLKFEIEQLKVEISRYK